MQVQMLDFLGYILFCTCLRNQRNADALSKSASNISIGDSE